MDKDFDAIDIDLLKCLEQLSLGFENSDESINGECTEECKICKNNNTNEKSEDADKIFAKKVSQAPVNKEKVPFIKEELDDGVETELSIGSTFIKKEKPDYEIESELLTSSFIKEEEELNEEIKSEPVTDYSSSDDENYVTLIERGPDKRSHKAKSRKRKPYPSRSEYDGTILLHCASGCVVMDNSRNFHSSYTSTNYNLTIGNESQYIENIHSPESRSQSSAYSRNLSRTNCNLTVGNEKRYIPNVGSPESGYDTSQSSTHSPSPPIEASSSPPVYEDQEKKKKIREIINSFLEVEKEVLLKSKSNSESDFVRIDFNTQNAVENECADSISDFVRLADFSSSDENGCSSGYSDNEFARIAEIPIQNKDEEIVINSYLDLQELLRNLSTSEAADFSLETFEQSPVLCCTHTKQESFKRKISPNIKDSAARKALRNSLNPERYKAEEAQMLRKIQHQGRKNETLKIIDCDEREPYKTLNQTNLHSAVIESNAEKVYCIIEAVKRFGLDFFAINNKDDNKKTALDYAVMQNMPLLVAYLEDNNAVQTVKC